MPKHTAAEAKLISDAPLWRLVAALEDEAAVIARYDNGSVRNISSGWLHRLKAALAQAAREQVTVPLADLAVPEGRSPRTLRRRARQGELPGAWKRGRTWVVSAGGSRD